MFYNVINDLEATIKFFIEEKIPELKYSAGEIIFDSPVNIKLPVTKPTLAIYLHQKERNPYMSNASIKYKEVPGHPEKLVKIYPPTAMDLYYMFSIYDAIRTSEKTIFEKLVYYFKSSLILKGDVLQGSLAAAGNTKIKIYAQDLSLDDISKLWGTFPNTASRMALFFKVSPVLIPRETEEEVIKISEKEIRVKDMD